MRIPKEKYKKIFVVRFVVARKIPTPRLGVAAVQFAPLSVVAAGILHGEHSRLIA
jgi:hypothetical protein